MSRYNKITVSASYEQISSMVDILWRIGELNDELLEKRRRAAISLANKMGDMYYKEHRDHCHRVMNSKKHMDELCDHFEKMWSTQ